MLTQGFASCEEAEKTPHDLHENLHFLDYLADYRLKPQRPSMLVNLQLLPRASCTFNTSEHPPVAATQVVEAELVSDLGSIHGIGQVLLVGENQQRGVTQLVLQPQPSPSASRPRAHNTLRKHAARRTSLSIRISSSRASPTRSRSLLSTTKMRP